MPRVSLDNLIDIYYQIQDAYKDLNSQEKIDELLRIESLHKTTIIMSPYVKTNPDIFKNHKKYHFSTLEPIDLEFQLNDILNTNNEFIDTQIFEDLLIYTGEYFPLSTIGYYSKKKEHIDQWLKYLSDNKDMYRSGRWFRYGKYVEDKSIIKYRIA